jgi:hypothetical protein
VPKETKRFINPLLRPSSNVESLETKPEPTQIQSEPLVASTKTTTDTSAVTSTETSAPPISEAAPFSAPILPKASSVLPDSQVVASLPQTSRSVTYPSTETSTYQVRSEERPQSQVREPIAAEMQRRSQASEQPAANAPEFPPELPHEEDVSRYSSAPIEYVHNTVPASEAEFEEGYTSTFPSLAAAVVSSPVGQPSPPLSVPFGGEDESSHLAEESTFAATLPQTSTSTYVEQRGSFASTRHDEFGEQEFYTPPPVRRRRGAQSFEKTHERITVWVDKRLKQAFEELAYAEETSKTALLNEALADLLRKHSSR